MAIVRLPRSPSYIKVNAMRQLCLIVAVAVASLIVGYAAGRQSHQNANDLIAAGFTITDCDGYECEKFDDGLYTAFPTYWTYNDKQ